MTSPASPARRSVRGRLRRALVSVVIGLAITIVALWIWTQRSPWPGVLLIRHGLGDGMEDAQRIAEYVPDDVTRRVDVVYEPGDADGRLDVLYPEEVDDPLPTVVWVHGGAFVAGTKDALRDYLAVLASHGFTVVNIEYTKAPTAVYPRPVEQLDTALRFVVDHADELYVDPQQLVLAGDSAGAHIAAQTAMAMTDPAYAQAAGLPVTSDGARLRAAILASGAFDLAAIDLEDEQFGWFLRTVLWAYSGEKDFAADERFWFASLPEHVSTGFPPTFLTTGPADPLLSHSLTMAEALRDEGVEVDTLFFPAETTDASIGHEYQLRLDTPEAREAMERMIALLRAHTDGPNRAGVSDRW